MVMTFEIQNVIILFDDGDRIETDKSQLNLFVSRQKFFKVYRDFYLNSSKFDLINSFKFEI